MTWDILVVEDEEDSQQVVSTVLTYHGVRAHLAADGHQCLAALEQALPTAIIMDLNLPGLDGWETFVQIRSDPATAHIPVVAITAYHSANVAQDALAAGFDAYLPKPVDSDVLMDTLHEIIEG
jgi:two-component system response regulator